MPDDVIDLLAIERGAATAPAGCGKTHLIAEALTRHSGKKPILILTHTNAGVVALRGRLDRASVPVSLYKLMTIDGWAMRLFSMFPGRTGRDPELLKLANPATDYPNIRAAAATLLREAHIGDILEASYARLIVDEYQDCSLRQHALVSYAAETLPTCVLGDPMQAIFGFGEDNLAEWNDVCGHFPIVGQLETPWRWINADAEPLGRWLLEARDKLLRGEPIDLLRAPEQVRWIELDGSNDYAKQLAAGRARTPDGQGGVLIIGDSRNPASQRQFAGRTPGAVTVEAVDLRDFVVFAQRFALHAADALEQLMSFADNIVTNAGGADVAQRIRALVGRGRARTNPSDAELAGLRFLEQPSYQRAADLLTEISKQGGARIHRPAVYRAGIRALQLCEANDGMNLGDAAIRIREQSRLVGRPLPGRAVGSTLLLKGLEAEVAVVLDAGGLDARNLYVAITRGSQKLVVCSSSAVLNP